MNTGLREMLVAIAVTGVTGALAVLLLVLVLPGRGLQIPARDVAPIVAPPQARTLTPAELRQVGLDVLPAVVLPPDNPSSDAKVELGKLLFFDNRMSGNGTISCAFCHVPQLGWGDGRDLSLGYTNTLHWRNSQTIINSAYMNKFFWAGESLSLESQAKSAWTGAAAQNLDPAMAEERLRQIPGYVQRFKDVFGADVPSFDDALRAVAAFEATITSQNVPFDRYVAGDEGVLSESAKRGMGLFVGSAGCIQCHGGPLFTDQSFYNLGVPPNPAFESDPLRQIMLRYQHRARGVPEVDYRSADGDLGLYYVTKVDADRGKFRTPTLREVGQTGPYMHNGVFDTLGEVVEFYNQGGGDDRNRSRRLRPLGLSPDEVSDLVAFLESLTGDQILVDPPPFPEYEVMP